ncbi:MAG: class I SAM-dependent methyltransferase, partial [Firmicutes bacterium]|nr:class I SAM-dependent methyltransferase [Bacillota bacterium]
MKTYNIKDGYHCNPVGHYTGSTRNSIRYQVPVYQFAAKMIQKFGLKSCMDIGCGFGTKIASFLHPVCDDITGIDLAPSIAHCKSTYNFGRWFVDNIEVPHLALDKKFDLILVSDVIEHLLDPDKLFEYIKKYSTQET